MSHLDWRNSFESPDTQFPAPPSPLALAHRIGSLETEVKLTRLDLAEVVNARGALEKRLADIGTRLRGERLTDDNGYPRASSDTLVYMADSLHARAFRAEDQLKEATAKCALSEQQRAASDRAVEGVIADLATITRAVQVGAMLFEITEGFGCITDIAAKFQIRVTGKASLVDACAEFLKAKDEAAKKDGGGA